MHTYTIPVVKGCVSSFKNDKIRLIIKGPENCSKFEKAAKNPPIKNVTPMYFLKAKSSFPTLVLAKA